MHHVLQLDLNGTPQAWMTPEDIAGRYCTGDVAWTVGEPLLTLRGGTCARTGEQSRLDIHPIVALRGSAQVNLFDAVPPLANRALFTRDRMMCAYCGGLFDVDHLTREHVMPQSRGGLDRWENVVAACRGCNHRKGARTPEQAGMPLLYLPYAPSVFEGYLLSGRRIRADVQEWLMARVPKHSRLLS